MRTVSQRLVMFASLLVVPAATEVPSLSATLPKPETDPRLVRLQQFLAERDCPIEKYASDFIEAADAHDLDWRLLPSISFVESGGGKQYTNNNVFGWDSCRQRFASIRDGIHTVASRLANSQLYRNKDLEGKLRTYNPVADHYPALVKSVMRSIAPTPALAVN